MSTTMSDPATLGDLLDQMSPADAARHGIGGNQLPEAKPPTPAELETLHLPDVTAALKLRADRLNDAADKAIAGGITDADLAGRGALLVKQMRDHHKAIDIARTERKAPFLEAGRVVDAHYKGLAFTLNGTDPDKTGGKALQVSNLVFAFEAEERRKAAAEQQRLADEAKREREKAERLRREAEEASQKAEAAAGPDQPAPAMQEAALLGKQIEAEEASQKAEAAERQATAVVAPRAAGWGASTSRRTTYKAEITDLDKALAFARERDPTAILAAVQGVVDRQLRAATDKASAEFPGVKVVPVTGNSIR
jgi:hypothetical protein